MKKLGNENYYAKMMGFDNEQKIILYEKGSCNLRELMEYKRSKKEKWEEDDLLYMSYSLIDFCLKLDVSKVYHSDWKPDNVIIDYE